MYSAAQNRNETKWKDDKGLWEAKEVEGAKRDKVY